MKHDSDVVFMRLVDAVWARRWRLSREDFDFEYELKYELERSESRLSKVGIDDVMKRYQH